jgi:hypothetical protein
VCPSWASTQVIKRGCDDTEPTRQRYACHDCHTRFDDLTDTIFAGHHQPLKVWVLCLYCMGLHLSNEYMVHERDVDRCDVPQKMATVLVQCMCRRWKASGRSYAAAVPPSRHIARETPAFPGVLRVCAQRPQTWESVAGYAHCVTGHLRPWNPIGAFTETTCGKHVLQFEECSIHVAVSTYTKCPELTVLKMGHIMALIEMG